METKRRVYSLQGYPEEVIAAVFAKTSRSPESFDKMAQEMSAEKSSAFHEKWVVAFGHGSVAEHANIHLAVENASRYSMEYIEGNRLAAFTEKSTRYQQIDKDAYYKPKEIMQSKYAKEYVETMDFLFDSYTKMLTEMIIYTKEKTPMRDGEKEKTYEGRVRGIALDAVRFLLPYSTLANVGITINARELQSALVKMLSSHLSEVREIAEEMKAASMGVMPTLVKFAAPDERMMEIERRLYEKFRGFEERDGREVKLVHYDKDGVNRVLAAITYRYGQAYYERSSEDIEKKSPAEKKDLLEILLSKFVKPGREFEHLNYTFDLTMDLGAFCEFKRHRMCTITAQLPTVKNGYVIPEEIVAAGLKNDFKDAMERAAAAFQSMHSELPFAAGYMVTNAHRRRVLATMNMRELFHFIRLRSSPAAHFTIRKLALGMLEELKRVEPELASYITNT